MILRRFMQHLKEHNWFAVGLDVIVVIVGIFLGMQVTEWNDERVLKSKEREYLSGVYDEVLYSAESIVLRLEFTEQIVESGKRALKYLDGDSSCEPDCNELIIDFFHASQYWATQLKQDKYNEVVRLGFPSDTTAESALRDLYNYFDGWEGINGFSPEYRETVRSYFPAGVFEVLWDSCHKLHGGGREELLRDCKDDLSSYDTSSTLKAIHRDENIRNELRFWIGQNLFAVKINPTISEQATLTSKVMSDLLDNWD